jgi:hypothetical protein
MLFSNSRPRLRVRGQDHRGTLPLRAKPRLLGQTRGGGPALAGVVSVARRAGFVVERTLLGVGHLVVIARVNPRLRVKVELVKAGKFVVGEKVVHNALAVW